MTTTIDVIQERRWRDRETGGLEMPTINEQIIKAFANSFQPPLKCVRTERVNNVKKKDAWSCSVWNADARVGIVAVAYDGEIKAYIECYGKGEKRIETMAEIMHQALSQLTV